MTTRTRTARELLHPHTPAQDRLRAIAVNMHPSIINYHTLELSLMDIRMPNHTDVAQDGLHLADLTGVMDPTELADTMTAFAQTHQPTRTAGARHPDHRIAETPHGFIYFQPVADGTAFLLTPWHATITPAANLRILIGHLAQRGERYIDQWD